MTGIQESPDKLSFKFQMIDENGLKQEVLYAEPIPTDFTKSEQVVIVGAYQGEKFVADKILLKCPSKYQEDPEFTS
ncbi:MAG: cytochrome c maturation protein CcmE [Bacteroidota bacterium]